MLGGDGGTERKGEKEGGKAGKRRAREKEEEDKGRVVEKGGSLEMNSRPVNEHLYYEGWGKEM